MNDIKPIFIRGINPVVPTVYDDGLSYMEAVAKLQKKINEIVEVVNGLDITSVREEMNELKLYVDGVVVRLQNELGVSLNANREWVQEYTRDIVTNVESMLSTQDDYIKTWVRNALDDFRREVDLLFWSPITGDTQPLNTIVKQLYNRIFSIIGALTASEYDSLGLTASEYDSANLTAFEYDTQGRTLLQNI